MQPSHDTLARHCHLLAQLCPHLCKPPAQCMHRVPLTHAAAAAPFKGEKCFSLLLLLHSLCCSCRTPRRLSYHAVCCFDSQQQPCLAIDDGHPLLLPLPAATPAAAADGGWRHDVLRTSHPPSRLPCAVAARCLLNCRAVAQQRQAPAQRCRAQHSTCKDWRRK